MKATIYERRESPFAEQVITILGDVDYFEIKDGFVEFVKATPDNWGCSWSREQRGLFAADEVLRVIMEKEFDNE